MSFNLENDQLWHVNGAGDETLVATVERGNLQFTGVQVPVRMVPDLLAVFLPDKTDDEEPHEPDDEPVEEPEEEEPEPAEKPRATRGRPRKATTNA